MPASPGAYYLQNVRSGALTTIAYSLGVGTGLDIAGPGRLVVEALSVPTNLLEVPLTNARRTAEVADAGIAGQLPARRFG